MPIYLDSELLLTYLSTAIATKVKTEAATDIPWTNPLILHIMLPNGQPEREMKQSLKRSFYSML
jgi:hypothetical protein